jgi:GH35 family endo-1,4-beta-xylanase
MGKMNRRIFAALTLLLAFRLVIAGQEPELRTAYAGQDAGAAWRKAAAERIEQIRKGDLKIIVTRGGKAVPGAEVHVAMQRHAFGFGTEVEAKRLLEASPENERYRQILLRFFNNASIKQSLDWPEWTRDSETGMKAVNWLRAHGLEVHGHCLVCPSWKHMPPSLKELEEKQDTLRMAVRDHVHEEVWALHGQCVEWDVIDEANTNTDLQNILGPNIFTECYRRAQEADPQAKLYINDDAIFSSAEPKTLRQDAYEKTIRGLIAAGAPLQGIGLQSHAGEDLAPPERILAILDRFAAFGLPLQGTEYGPDIPNEQLQADYTRDYLTVMFSHPAVTGVMLSGFWEKAHGLPRAASFRKDSGLSPAAKVWKDLVFKQWWTDMKLRTAADGTCAARGFLGSYKIEVRAGKKSKTAETILGKDGGRIEVALD